MENELWLIYRDSGGGSCCPELMPLSVALGDPGDFAEYSGPAIYRDFADYGDLADYQEPPVEQTGMQPDMETWPPTVQMAAMTSARPGITWIPPGTFDEWQKKYRQRTGRVMELLP